MRVLAAGTSSTDWALAGAWLAGGMAVSLAVGRLVDVLARPFNIQDYTIKLLRALLSTGIMLVAGIYALRQLGVAVGPLVGAVGVSCIIIALALQPVMGNLVAAIMIHARRPIRPGDQIESHDHRGTVLEINSRAVVVLSFDGEIVYLPNLSVLDQPLLNQTKEGYRRTVLPFQVGYDADLRRTQGVLVFEPSARSTRSAIHHRQRTCSSRASRIPGSIWWPASGTQAKSSARGTPSAR